MTTSNNTIRTYVLGDNETECVELALAEAREAFGQYADLRVNSGFQLHSKPYQWGEKPHKKFGANITIECLDRCPTKPSEIANIIADMAEKHFGERETYKCVHQGQEGHPYLPRRKRYGFADELIARLATMGYEIKRNRKW